MISDKIAINQRTYKCKNTNCALLFDLSQNDIHLFPFLALRCTVTKEDEVTILVEDINDNLKHTEISLRNHTACDCSCNQECNSATQRLNQDSCSCECIEDGSHCEEANKKWIKGLCKCGCRLRPNCRWSETWSESLCKCEESGASIRGLF